MNWYGLALLALKTLIRMARTMTFLSEKARSVSVRDLEREFTTLEREYRDSNSSEVS